MKNTSYLTKTALIVALLAAFQLLLYPIISVQPITITLFYLVMLEPFVIPAFVAMMLPIASGMFSGLGPWTAFQCLGWLAVVYLFRLSKRIPAKKVRNALNILMLIIAALLFGFISNLSMLPYLGGINLKTLAAVEASGILFDLIHAANNVALYIISFKFIEKLKEKRY